MQLFLGCTDPLTAEFVSDRTGLASVAVTSKAKQLATFRVTDYTPEYRETSGVGKRPVLTPDEVLRLPIDEALIIVRGMKPLKVHKYDYSMHPEFRKLKHCKASAYIPAWRQHEIEKGKKKKSPKPKSSFPNPSEDTPSSPPSSDTQDTVREIIGTTKDSIMDNL